MIRYILKQRGYEIKTSEFIRNMSLLGPISSPLKSSIDIELFPRMNRYNQENSHVYKADDSGDFSFAGGEWKEEKNQV